MSFKIKYHKDTLIIRNAQQEWQFTNSAIGAALLIAMYIAGIVGMTLPIRSTFALLTPLNLLLSLALVLRHHKHWTRRFILTIIVCGIAGYASEVVGVQTGLIFGQYAYGHTLGLQWQEVPLILAVNWLMLLYTSAMVINHFWHSFHPVLKALLSAALMVALDVLIEPVAMKLDFWMWEGGHIPLQNFVGWLVIAFGLQLLLQYSMPRDTRNHMGVLLFGLQVLFFGALNLLL